MSIIGIAVVPIMIAGPGLAPAATQTQEAPIALGAEAWYSSPRLCVIPQLCLPISSPLDSTYPARTLHIGAAGGSESARTYLSLRKPLTELQTVTGGVLRLPLDTNPADGSVAPDLAKVKACTTSARIKSVEGSTATPPPANCTGAPVSRIVGTPATELDIDLKPIAARLSRPGTSLALLPVLSPGATWDVTVSSNRRARSSTTTPVLILSIATRAATVSHPPLPDVSPTPVTDEPSAAAPPLPVEVGPQVSQAPTGPVGAPQIAPTRPAAFRVGPHSFDYPVVFLVPLLILVGLLGFGRQLTRPLTRRDS